MEIELKQATESDIPAIYQMQKSSFKELLAKYKDYDTNPGAEDIHKITEKFNQSNTCYLLIINDHTICGAIRIVTEKYAYRVSPVFIIPEYQNNGIAQTVFKIIESKFTVNKDWILSTIKEENKNCYLYEKIGYHKTGREEVIKNGMTLVYYEKKVPNN